MNVLKNKIMKYFRSRTYILTVESLFLTNWAVLLLGATLSWMLTFSRRRPHLKASPFLLCLAIVANLSSCASLKQERRENMREISALSAFNGSYVNRATEKDDSEFSSLWNQLLLADRVDTLEFSKATIVLEAIDSDKIRATWMQDGIWKKSIVVKGKLKDNYFVSRRKRSVIPIPLIYGEIKNNQFQLWLDKDNLLHIDRMQNGWGWVFLFLAGNDRTVTYQYQHRKD
jgi:hypothetical protein